MIWCGQNCQYTRPGTDCSVNWVIVKRCNVMVVTKFRLFDGHRTNQGQEQIRARPVILTIYALIKKSWTNGSGLSYWSLPIFLGCLPTPSLSALSADCYIIGGSVFQRISSMTGWIIGADNLESGRLELDVGVPNEFSQNRQKTFYFDLCGANRCRYNMAASRRVFSVGS